MGMILIQISIYCTVIPIALGAFRYTYLSKNQRLLFWMIFLITINQFTSQFLESNILYIDNNLPFYRVYILIEFIFLSSIFIRFIRPNKAAIALWLVNGAFFLYWSIDSFILSSIWKYPDYLRFVESLLIIGFCCIYFYRIFQMAKVVLLSKEFGFWLSAGALMYFASNSVLFLFSEFVVSLSDATFYLLWAVHAFLTILLYIAYTIAIQCKTNHNLS